LDEDSDSVVLIASKAKERKRKYKSTDDDVEDEDDDDDEEAEVNLESEDEEFMISTTNRSTKLKADLTTDDSEEQDSDDASSRNRGRSHQAAKDGEYTLDDSKGTRRSSRSTKFTASLKEPTGESFRYLDVTSSSHTDYNRKSRSRDISRENKTSKKPSVHKNSASQHKAVRRQVSNDVSVSEEDMTGSEDDKDSDEDLKIQRIIASKSERRGVWKELCKKLNTSEIEAGSRWFEDSEDEKLDEDTFEERFLIKWDDLSYLHCSWETQKDLMEQLDNAKAYLKTFFRKSINGFLFTPDERLDGDYFDPSYIQIERILEVEIPENGSSTNKFGIVLDKKNPNYSIGTGRQFLIKWVSLPYSECTYEFERDLIRNDVDYEEQAESFCRRSKKVRILYHVFN
jgi:Chromo (CHRromatin Organisation MOdifier) domain